MADGGNFVNHLSNYVGETVTIFTTSGGPSGFGFTGVLILVNPFFVRIITQVGPAPGCALGECCFGVPKADDGFDGGVFGGVDSGSVGGGVSGTGGGGVTGRFNCRVNTVGSVTDIPIDRIAAFVHNAV